MSVVIDADPVVEYEKFQAPVPAKSTPEKITEVLLQSGLWPLIIQRPYGTIANPGDRPKAVFISGFDSAPLAPDMNFVLKDEYDNLVAGIEALKKLTDGEVHLGLRNGENGVLNRLTNAAQHLLKGRIRLAMWACRYTMYRPSTRAKRCGRWIYRTWPSSVVCSIRERSICGRLSP